MTDKPDSAPSEIRELLDKIEASAKAGRAAWLLANTAFLIGKPANSAEPWSRTMTNSTKMGRKVMRDRLWEGTLVMIASMTLLGIFAIMSDCSKSVSRTGTQVVAACVKSGGTWVDNNDRLITSTLSGDCVDKK